MDRYAEILEGSIDMHLHAKPDFHPRLKNELEILIDAKKYKMKGIVSKSHYCINSDRMDLINSQIEGIKCYGGVVLNPTVGGLNPVAVEAAILYGGKEVWMPSFYTKAHKKNFPDFKGAIEVNDEGISIIDEEKKLVPVMHTILDLIAQGNVILGTSHCSEEEIFILVREAKKHKVKKIIITHPYCPVPNLDIGRQLELSELGVFLELCFFSTKLNPEKVDINDFVNTINSIGPERIVLATDFGQSFNPTPPDGFLSMVKSLLAKGIKKSDINIMIKDNPNYLLGL